MLEQPNREKEIFSEALERDSPAVRLAYVQGACGSDHALRKRVEALLKAYASAGGFIPNRDGPDPEMPTVPAPVPLSEGPGTVIDRYKLLQHIGEGGFGAVYMAEQQAPVKRRVALKIIKLGMDTRQVVARFESERQALALMDHPNIAKVLDAGATESGRPYFVMELVRGVAITQYCDENNLPPVKRLTLFMQVCRAIQHAHQKGLIHRDIKPSNILVTLHDGVPVPKVIDFGIAKATQQELTAKTVFTQFQQFIGTPAYMSPEQAEMSGLDIDTRSDIYSLGVLLYELLTGQTPFDARMLLAAGLDAMRRTIREAEPVLPSTRLSTMVDSERTSVAKHRQSEAGKLIHLFRGDLDWIVMKCLEKERARRYETANGIAANLQRHLNNEPVAARPPSSAYRFHKALRRNKLVFTAASAVTLTLIAGLSFSTWAFLRERKAHASERAQRQTAVEAQGKAEAAQASEVEQHNKADAEKITAQRHLYGANMNLAQQAWEQNNIVRLWQLLEETQASPDRGFEWYYWQRHTHLALKTLRGHLQAVHAVAFSPNGQWIVTGSYDHTAKVWDAASGRVLLTLKGHTTEIRSVAISPDGQRIATGSHDHTAKMWDAANGRELLAIKGHSARIWSVAFSPDGQRIVTGSDDQTAKVWEEASGRELLTLKGHSGLIKSVAFSPDSQRIVTGSADKTAKVWDATSGQELLTLRGHTASIWSVAFSPDGQWIATGSDDGTAKVWQTARAEQVAGWREEERAAAQYLAAIQRESDAEQQSQRIARARDEGAIKQWLILAPIPFATGQSGADAVDTEQIEGEGRLRPKAGEGTAMVSGELKWQEMAQEDYVMDFNVILGDLTQQSVAYAVCYLRSEFEQRGLRMLLGSDDEAKVYLNGKQIHKSPVGRGFVADQDTVPEISVNAGLNVLVFKVVNEFADWKGSIRFTDAQGNPVKGIKVTLDPEAKEKTELKQP